MDHPEGAGKMGVNHAKIHINSAVETRNRAQVVRQIRRHSASNRLDRTKNLCQLETNSVSLGECHRSGWDTLKRFQESLNRGIPCLRDL